uniref:Uncharacterized protein n=1 Tax=Meloidogyne enterolobii TaxID=390850 RepID=A0A6V7WMP6_MELEN|nr:unnamed protein product [Meloidogyne enterolobii]
MRIRIVKNFHKILKLKKKVNHQLKAKGHFLLKGNVLQSLPLLLLLKMI